MDERQYVNAIARRIKCNGKKKKEIKRQLLTDITMRTEQGEDFQEIISQMGTVKEIADGFNDNISEKEIRWKRSRPLCSSYYPWNKKEGQTIACCTDGIRPVVFKIEVMNDATE